jgi:ankyrin repeat protein
MLPELLAANPRVDLANGVGETPLLVAIRIGNRGAFDRLLAHGADVNARDATGRSALMSAILEDREAMAVALVEAGARFDSLLGTYTALRMARIKRHQILAALLAQKGAAD